MQAVLLFLVTLLAPGQSQAAVYAKLEAAFNITNLTTDPFDYAVTDVKVQIQQPDNTVVSLPAFFDGGTTWRVRHTPSTNGLYQVTGITMNGSALTVSNLHPAGWTVSGNPLNGGFVKVDSDNATRFVIGDDHYFPVGENVAWDQGFIGGYYTVTNILAKLGSAHANWSRIWMTSWDDKSLVWPEDGSAPPPLGLLMVTNAQVWDNIVNVAEQNGIRFQMVLNNYYEYYSGSDLGFWSENPYNTINGGFLSDAKQFFTSAQAKSLTKRKLRYVIARWGYSSAIMAWELFNEVEYTDAGRAGQTANITAWHNEMAQFLRAQDPYAHLITSSGADVFYPIFDQCDYYQHHDYPADVISGLRNTQTTPVGTPKPIFAGECATNGTPHLGLNAPLWAGLMSGQSGAAQPWWWDRIDFNNDYTYFRALSDFVLLSGLPEQESISLSAPSVTSSGSVLSAYQIGNNGYAAVWVWHKNNVFNTNAATTVSGTFSLGGLSSGTYNGVWWDTFTGVAISNFTFTVAGGSATITTPAILRSVALYAGKPPQAAITAPNLTQTLSNSQPALVLPLTLTNGGGLPFMYSLCITSAAPVSYTERDSHDPDGPGFAWHDISGVGTDITTNFTGLVAGKTAKDEGIAGPFALGFNFPFYNGMFSNLYVSPNGFVSFSPFAGDQSVNQALGSGSAPTNTIAFFWDDLDLTNSESHVYVAADRMAGTCTVQFQNVRFKAGTNKITCQLVLKTTGEILAQYRSLALSNTCTVGLQGPGAGAALELARDEDYLEGVFAVRLTPVSWLGLADNAGLVPRTNAETINVALNPAGLPAGTYTATLLLNTSDTNQPQFVLPVQFTVLAATFASLAEWRSNYFGTITNAGIAADTADPDADGLANVMEYAFHTNPTITNASPFTNSVVNGHLVITFQRTHLPPADIVYLYEVADDPVLGPWKSGPAYTTENVVDNLDATETVTVTDKMTYNAQSAHFLRVRVSTLPPLETWRMAQFGTTNNTGNAANAADPDNDGYNNLVEFACLTDPGIWNVGAMSGRKIGDHYCITFRRAHPAPWDITYSYQVTDAIGTSWQSGPAFTTESVVDNLDGTETVTVMDNALMSVTPRHFIRVQVSSP